MVMEDRNFLHDLTAYLIWAKVGIFFSNIPMHTKLSDLYVSLLLGKSVPTCLVCHWNDRPSVWDIPVPTEH